MKHSFNHISYFVSSGSDIKNKMVAKYGLLVLVAVVSSATALAPCVCTRNLKPVCGSDGKTYANQCILDCEVYKGKQITKERDGSCEPEQRVCTCTFDYTPVCGSDGQTYPNECALKCDQATKPELRMAHPGECKAPVCTCTRDSKLVCGSDGTTYANKCLLECSQSVNPDLQMTHEGACDNIVQVVDNNPMTSS